MLIEARLQHGAERWLQPPSPPSCSAVSTQATGDEQRQSPWSESVSPMAKRPGEALRA